MNISEKIAEQIRVTKQSVQQKKLKMQQQKTLHERAQEQRERNYN